MITTTNISQANVETLAYESIGESGITTLMICNHTSGTTAVVDVYVIPSSAGSTSNANQMLKSLTIVPTDTFVMDMEKLVLSNGDSIVVKSDQADVVNVIISSMAVA